MRSKENSDRKARAHKQTMTIEPWGELQFSRHGSHRDFLLDGLELFHFPSSSHLSQHRAHRAIAIEDIDNLMQPTVMVVSSPGTGKPPGDRRSARSGIPEVRIDKSTSERVMLRMARKRNDVLVE
jgi:hypothetical protein